MSKRIRTIPCEVREELQRKVEEAYKEAWDSQYESKSADAKARARLNRLLGQQYSHERKHGCLRVSDSKEPATPKRDSG